MATTQELQDFTQQVRRDILRMVHAVNSGHPGGSLGCAEFFTVLYQEVLEYSTEFSMDGKNPKALADGKISAKLPVWAEAGVRNTDGGALPVKDLTARLVIPAGSDGPAFLVYSNFDSILDWNRSNYYALAVGHLSDKLR